MIRAKDILFFTIVFESVIDFYRQENKKEK
jgi:hypothetical protein